MLKLNSLCKSYGGLAVLENLSYDFETGITVILAPSGSGKTTLLRIIAGLDKADFGSVSLPEGAKISVNFQEDRLLPTLTALENVALPIDNKKLALKWLEKMGISDFASYLPDQLSGGMKRRVALARALAYNGDILLLDEPFKGLDTATKEHIINVVKDERKGKTTLLITHDIFEAQRCGDTVIIASGPPLKFSEIIRGDEIETIDTKSLQNIVL